VDEDEAMCVGKRGLVEFTGVEFSERFVDSRG
jgi:hypothetical protein